MTDTLTLIISLGCAAQIIGMLCWIVAQVVEFGRGFFCGPEALNYSAMTRRLRRSSSLQRLS